MYRPPKLYAKVEVTSHFGVFPMMVTISLFKIKAPKGVIYFVLSFWL